MEIRIGCNTHLMKLEILIHFHNLTWKSKYTSMTFEAHSLSFSIFIYLFNMPEKLSIPKANIPIEVQLMAKLSRLFEVRLFGDIIGFCETSLCSCFLSWMKTGITRKLWTPMATNGKMTCRFRIFGRLFHFLSKWPIQMLCNTLC